MRLIGTRRDDFHYFDSYAERVRGIVDPGGTDTLILEHIYDDGRSLENRGDRLHFRYGIYDGDIALPAQRLRIPVEDGAPVIEYIEVRSNLFVSERPYYYYTIPLAIDLDALPGGAVAVAGTNGDDAIAIPDGEPPLPGTYLFEPWGEVYGNGGDDTIALPSATPYHVYGGAGGDLVRASGAPVRARGDNGDDTLLGARAADTLMGGADDDLLRGGAGDDELMADGRAGFFPFGVDNADTIFGGAGDDFIDGGGGPDRLTGGAGDDLFFLRAGVGAKAVVTDFETGADRLAFGPDFSFAPPLLNTTVSTREGRTVIRYGDSGDKVVLRGVEAAPHELFADVDASRLGTGAHEALSGGRAPEWIEGRGGDDTLDGGRGNDIVQGGRGDDLILGDGALIPPARGGADLLSGGAGDDTLVGGPGPDLMSGGPGADQFQFLVGQRDAEADTIYDFEPDVDSLLIDTNTVPGEVEVRDRGFQTEILYAGTLLAILSEIGVGADELTVLTI